MPAQPGHPPVSSSTSAVLGHMVRLSPELQCAPLWSSDVQVGKGRSQLQRHMGHQGFAMRRFPPPWVALRSPQPCDEGGHSLLGTAWTPKSPPLLPAPR